MENSIFLAKIIGPYCIIIAIGILLNREMYVKIMEDFIENSALIYLGGALALIIGLLIVLTHNVWVAGWPVIITIFGWLGIIKGAWLFIFPGTITKFMEVYQKKSSLLVVHLVLILIIGLGLSVSGYLTG
ncbi:MAG: hypothetical protein KAS66_13470 [Candidatus Omnitrophica bacterium]|nr:hypothetical protein [Candidatus Omnitrophota bacterium]MCK5083288.1 hypothetical protein [Candidatus Omnitrophota bacterium]